MSNDYKLILPLMLTTIITTLLAEHLYSESVYTAKLRLKGIVLQHGWDLDLMQSLTVREVMAKLMPRDSVIVCVRRASVVTIPLGDTVLQSGDLVSIFLRHTDEEALRICLLGRSSQSRNLDS